MNCNGKGNDRKGKAFTFEEVGRKENGKWGEWGKQAKRKERKGRKVMVAEKEGDRERRK